MIPNHEKRLHKIGKLRLQVTGIQELRQFRPSRGVDGLHIQQLFLCRLKRVPKSIEQIEILLRFFRTGRVNYVSPLHVAMTALNNGLTKIFIGSMGDNGLVKSDERLIAERFIETHGR